jgi:hypothetical protein
MQDIAILNGKKPDNVQYSADVDNSEQECALNPNHTHFILIDNDQPPTDPKGWGEEIQYGTLSLSPSLSPLPSPLSFPLCVIDLG